MNQDTLALLVSIFDELKYLLSGDIVLVKEHLLLLVEPVECEVHNSHTLPLVLDLFARTVYDFGDLISHNEFDVLQALVAAHKGIMNLLKLRIRRQ